MFSPWLHVYYDLDDDTDNAGGDVAVHDDEEQQDGAPRPVLLRGQDHGRHDRVPGLPPATQ